MKDKGDQGFFGLSIKWFLVISVLVHTVLFVAIYFAPSAKEKKQREFVTKLVTEEKKKAEVKQPRKKEKPLPKPKLLPIPKIILPVRPVPVPEKNLAPAPQVSPHKSEQIHEAPAVPGEGKVTEHPSQEKIHPKEGAGDKEGKGTGHYNREGEDDGKKNISKSQSIEKPGYLDRRKLFDRGEIDAIAKKDVSGKTRKDSSITFDTTNYKYAGYMALLRTRVESSDCWVQPPEATMANIYGDVYIRFTIMRNGRLGEVQLVKTSGYKILDDAALQTVRDCGPYWPLPDAWGIDVFSIQGQFIFSNYGYYLR